jgi:hypothetical protein
MLDLLPLDDVLPKNEGDLLRMSNLGRSFRAVWEQRAVLVERGTCLVPSCNQDSPVLCGRVRFFVIALASEWTTSL